ncbi:MAG: hypothetical protein O3B13_14470 [Planctomycetota bacterium]|nr:hypothetical protein [Planctomycetota bacterium]
MKDSRRFEFRFGEFKTPRFEHGDISFDEPHGEVGIVALTDELIPRPIGQPLKDNRR